MIRRQPSGPLGAWALWLLAVAPIARAEVPRVVAEPAGDRRVRVEVTRDGVTARGTFLLDAPDTVEVVDEKIEPLPPFAPGNPGWTKGAALAAVRAAECTVRGALEPDSLVVRAAPGPDGSLVEKGRDWEADLEWGTLGRLADGRVAEGAAVWVSYRAGLRRIDSVVLRSDGTLEVVKGEPHVVLCEPPAIPSDATRVVNVWMPGRVETIEAVHLFPILEADAPPEDRDPDSLAAARLPETLRRLESGEKMRVLAWGDSVTTYERWQTMFVERLKARFPRADVELVTEAWGGRNTGSYLAEPPGSEHEYRAKVLGRRPHLIVSEFVNDAGLGPEQVEERYARLLADFRGIGAEWIILTPHYVMPEWMGPGFVEKGQRDIDDDPRPYVAGLKAFVARHREGVALADGSRRYGRLWRRGIPYQTLMENDINHPNVFGHALFADALMEVFGPVPAAGR